jgi:nucleoside phosphorylase
MSGRQGRAVILTALGLESAAVRAWLANPTWVVLPSGVRYQLGPLTNQDTTWQVALLEIGEGNPNAAAFATQAIDRFNPDVVLFVGIAGSLVDSVGLGDVVAATRVDAYHGGKQAAEGFKARPVTWPAATLLEQVARQVRGEGGWLARLAEPPSLVPEVHLKPVLAGEVVIDSRQSRLYRFVRKHYNDAVAVEMEGAGLASAAHAAGGLPAMVIRGISDLAGGAKEASDAAGWQPRAAAHAAAFTVELLATLDPVHLPGRRQESEAPPKEPPPRPAVFELRGHERLTTFTGRDDLLEQLHDSLRSATGLAAVLALYGLGGVGKTQLAVEYAHHYRPDYDVVWWLRAEDPVTAAQDYAALAGPLGLPEAGQSDVTVVQDAVRGWLASHDRWLLLVDNAEDDQVLAGLLPDPLQGQVLVTSRNPVWRQRARPVWVDVFTPDQAVRFLLDRTGQIDQARASEVAEALGYLPLALDQAGAYIDQSGLSLATYLQRLRDAEGRALAEGFAADERQVATVWELSLTKVNEDAPAAAELLNLLAFLAPDDIPRDLLDKLTEIEELPEVLSQAAQDPFALDETIAVLRRYSLIRTEDETLSVHRLVQAVTRHRLSQSDQAGWATTATTLVNEALPWSQYETWPLYERLLPHLLASVDHAEQLQVAAEARARLLNQAGLYFWDRAQFSQARASLERTVALVETLYGPTHPTVAIALNNLANVLQDMGDLAGGRPLLERPWPSTRLPSAPPTPPSLAAPSAHEACDLRKREPGGPEAPR